MRWDQRVQRGHHFAIVDEVDNILIDEARTPLIISGASHEDSENYIRMAQIVRALTEEDYEVEEKDQTVSLTEVGIGHVEEMLGEPLSDPERPEDIQPEQARLMGFLAISAGKVPSAATRNTSSRMAKSSSWMSLPGA